LIDKCRGFEYGEKLTVTKLTTLETTAIRGDMIEVFTIMNGCESVLESDFFRLDVSGRLDTLTNSLRPGCDWIWPSSVSAIGYANSHCGTTCRVMLYDLPV